MPSVAGATESGRPCVLRREEVPWQSARERISSLTLKSATLGSKMFVHLHVIQGNFNCL